MKQRTFKDILSSFEKNDFRAFETLMKREKDLMGAT